MDYDKIKRLQAKAFMAARECAKRLEIDEPRIGEVFDVTWQIIEAELRWELTEAELQRNLAVRPENPLACEKGRECQAIRVVN